MKANELRVGNYVMFHNDIHSLSSIGQWMHTDKSIDEIPLDEVKPIILTEQWMINLGFTKFSKITFELNGIRIGINGDSFLFLCNQKWVHVFYVHQIQNIYFILTGEELQKLNIIQ